MQLSHGNFLITENSSEAICAVRSNAATKPGEGRCRTATSAFRCEAVIGLDPLNFRFGSISAHRSSPGAHRDLKGSPRPTPAGRPLQMHKANRTFGASLAIVVGGAQV
jgi:hypothetical protein